MPRLPEEVRAVLASFMTRGARNPVPRVGVSFELTRNDRNSGSPLQRSLHRSTTRAVLN